MHCLHSGNDVGEVRGLGFSQGCGDTDAYGIKIFNNRLRLGGPDASPCD